MTNQSPTLEDLELMSNNYGVNIYSLFLKNICKTYDKFISQLYKNLEDIICRLEQNKKIRFKDEEDRLTEEILSFLSACGYDATHDSFHGGGHCDLLVKVNNFTWLGEAKIHRDYDYLIKGFNQLTTRYATGTDSCSQGSLIVYCKTKDTVSVVNEWKVRLKSIYGDSCICTDQCNYRPSFSFYSTHKHESSGIDYKIKHIFVVLHYDPKDVKN
ncbi:hypothetical protein [Gilliamella intestini]|uniref:Uncharacterized protein n=1 Tax=Gilliamella intestini TaxID=1798183 RepID=A0A1C4BLU9_9GAMM|nr:hypothetical protein [Gilliamella intestini]SCC07827.1 hypothetical protein GA0061080_102228 [Gilliamella intestini]